MLFSTSPPAVGPSTRTPERGTVEPSAAATSSTVPPIASAWSSAAWRTLWDHARLWRFLQEWVDLLAAMPDALLESSDQALERLWLEPVTDAVAPLVPDADLETGLGPAIERLMGDPESRRRMGERARTLGKPDAAAVLARAVLARAEQRP